MYFSLKFSLKYGNCFNVFNSKFNLEYIEFFSFIAFSYKKFDSFNFEIS